MGIQHLESPKVYQNECGYGFDQVVKWLKVAPWLNEDACKTGSSLSVEIRLSPGFWYLCYLCMPSVFTDFKICAFLIAYELKLLPG